jgi:hypothetical protein
MSALPDGRGLHTMDEVVGETLSAIAARQAPDLTAWWHNPRHPNWQTVRRMWPELTDIADDPWDVDQAVREVEVCRRCRMGQPRPDGGVYGCGLGEDAWAGNPLHPGGSKLWYLVHVCLPYTEGEERRWEWRKRRCVSKERRALEIAGKAKVQSLGGITGVEVEDDAIPF